MTRLLLPDDSKGDYYCPVCQERRFSEDTVTWAVRQYFLLAKYTPEPAHQQKHEGDLKITRPLKMEEWIIEAKGQAPAEDSGSFLEGLGQILKARYGRDPNIFYALAMPHCKPFIQEADHIDGKDRECLHLHWIWVEQVEDSHFKVTISCPPGSMCECQKRIGGPVLV